MAGRDGSKNDHSSNFWAHEISSLSTFFEWNFTKELISVCLSSSVYSLYPRQSARERDSLIVKRSFWSDL